MKKFITMFLLLMGIVFVAPAQEHYPTRNVGGKTYYVYTVQAGDGLYAIGRKFGVTQAELHDANPGLTAEIKAGQTLLVPKHINETPVRQQNAGQNHIIEHTVQPKQTLYAISKMYGVTIEQIMSLNPGCEQGIKIGQILKIPVANAKTQSTTDNAVKKKTIVHKVARRETLYSISKQYNVAINDILALNPDAADGVTKGQQLHIPLPPSNVHVKNLSAQPEEPVTASIHVVKKRETLYSICHNYNLDINQLIALNPFLEKRSITPGDRLNLPESQEVQHEEQTEQQAAERQRQREETKPQQPPRPTEQAPKKQWYSTPSKNLPPRKGEFHVAFLLPFMATQHDTDGSSERFVEFYRGALLALDALKHKGITVHVHTYDITRDTNRLNAVLNLPELLTVDLIIGPAYKQQVPVVSRFARHHHIYTIVPFTSQIKPTDLHDHILQFNPTQQELYDLVADRMVRTCGRCTYVIAEFDNERGQHFTQSMEQALHTQHMHSVKIRLTPDNVDTLRYLIGSNKALLVLASDNANAVRPIIEQIENLHLPQYTLFGFEEWGDELLRMPRNLYYATLFAPNASEDYKRHYTEWFGIQPESTETPYYDLLGYDLTLYFVAALQRTANGSVQLVPKEMDNELMQSQFFFQKQPSGGLMNLNHCLRRWNGYAFSKASFYK